MSQRFTARTRDIGSTSRSFQRHKESTTTTTRVCTEDSRLFLEALEERLFHSLAPRKKWHVEKRNVRVDNVVTVADSNTVRVKLAVGRIINVHPGSDG